MVNWTGYELIIGCVDRPAVRAGAAVRHGRPAGRGLQGPRPRPAAAEHDARPPDDGANEDLSRRSRASAGGAASTWTRWSSSSSASASSSSSSAGSARSTSTRSSPRRSASSRSTPGSSSTIRRRRRRSCRASRSGRTRGKYVGSWTCTATATALADPPDPARGRAAPGRVPPDPVRGDGLPALLWPTWGSTSGPPTSASSGSASSTTTARWPWSPNAAPRRRRAGDRRGRPPVQGARPGTRRSSRCS